jgi:hypothetical protein
MKCARYKMRERGSGEIRTERERESQRVHTLDT